MANYTASQVLSKVFDAVGNLLNVNVSGIVGAGIATEAKQDDEIALLTTIDADTGSLVSTDFATQTTLAAINAKLVTGTDIGDVTINNAAGASAVNIQDGGNSLTVDGTITANAGTNLNTSALALETGGNLASIATNTSTGTPQYGTDATGADAYATIVTTTAAKKHLYIVNVGAFPAIISLDGGTTDHLYLPGNSASTFDQITIGNGVNIQAKNGTPGSNYTNLYMTTW